MKAHLYGTAPHHPDAAFFSADELSHYSGGNTGNLLFCHSISRMLDTGAGSIAWGADITHLSPNQDCLVLPLANQLGRHVDLGALALRFAQVKLPMVGIGLGAQGPIDGIDADSIPEGSWEWVRVLASKAPSSSANISLRGEASRHAIASRGLGDHCVVTGCPSNFINPSATLGREIYRRRANGLARVAVAAGNPFLPQFKVLEQSLIQLVEKSEGVYVCQHPIDMLRLIKQEYSSIERQKFLRYKDYIHPYLCDDSFLSWFRRYGYSYSSVPEWLTSMGRFDLVIGTRIHGVMAGIQAGTPSLCLCIDSRTLELCQTMGIPHVDANDYREGISLQQVEDILREWNWRVYDEKRRELAQTLSSFLRNNSLEPHGTLTSILRERARVATSFQAKFNSNGVHQVSTASFDGRYPSIFSTLRAIISDPAPKILSYGCSDGFETNDLSRKFFHHSHIVGCDVDVDALRIARSVNRTPSRVQIIESNPDEIRSAGPYDAVTAMAVLCRWPDTREMDDISIIYPFKKFEESIEFFTSIIKLGGILCIYNANYLVTDTLAAERLEIVHAAGLVPKTQPVKVFDRTGRPLDKQELDGVLFRKIA